MKNNALVGAQIATCLAQLRQPKGEYKIFIVGVLLIICIETYGRILGVRTFLQLFNIVENMIYLLRAM